MPSKIIRGLLGLIGLTLVFNGAMWAFAPASNLEVNAISVASVLGMNMIKSDIGAPLMSVGIFLVLYALKRGLWFYPSVIIAGMYAIVRGVSVLVDGAAQMALVGVGLELFVVALLIIDRKLSPDPSA